MKAGRIHRLSFGFSIALVIGLLLCGAVFAQPSSSPSAQLAASNPGAIAGHVYEDDGTTPLSGVYVYAHVEGQLDQTMVGYALTSADGSFTILDLNSGTYSLLAMGNEQFAWEYYQDTRDNSSAAGVTVLAGQTTPNINFSLDPTGSISGHISTQDTALALADIAVSANPFSEPSETSPGYAASDGDGAYTIMGLVPGNYRIRASGNASYAWEYYQNTQSSAAATSISVGAGQAVTDIDLVLDPTGAVSGYVYASNGTTPLADISVYAYDADAGGTWVGHSQTTANGAYTITALPAGDYVLQAMGNALNVWEYYDAARDSSAASRVTVSGGATTTNIDFSLDAAGQIEGMVYAHDGSTPLSVYVYAYAYDDPSMAWQGYALSAADGTFAISGLAPGDYRVQAMGNQEHIWEYHQDTQDADGAQRVTVPSGASATGINIVLGQSGSMSGHVYAADGTTPLAGISLELSHYDSGAVVATLPSSTDVNGEFSIGTLAPGDYRVLACGNGDYLGQYYSNAYESVDADRVTVLGGQATSDVDFSLSQAHSGHSLDGDAKLDTVVWRPGNGTWYALLSSKDYSTSASFVKTWGSSAQNDVPIAGDLDGDGKTDLIVWRQGNGNWYGLLSSQDYAYTSYFVKPWGSGALEDTPMAGDLDADGKMDLIVWRPGNGTWYALLSSHDYSTASSFAKTWGSGARDDMPMAGDLDGDGEMDLIVWRPDNGTWYGLLSSQDYSTASSFAKAWGSDAHEDVPMAGDIDGDGKMDLIIWRPGNGTWYALLSSQDYAYASMFVKTWGSGARNDVPIAGDLDGDAKTDLIVWRPGNGTWYGLLSSQDYDTSASFAKTWGSGALDDVPIYPK